MRIRCRYCGAQFPKELGPEPQECVQCGRSVDGSMSAGSSMSGSSSRHSRPADEFEPLGWADDRIPSVLGGQDLEPTVSGESETIAPMDDMKLGHLPTAADSIDISELLTDGGHGLARPDAGSAFDLGHHRTESLPVSGEKGWRVRDGRGVVYEFDSVTELRSFLEDCPEPGDVRVARGLGPFRAVEDYEDLSMDASVDAFDESDIRSKFVDDSAFITAHSVDGHDRNFLDDDAPLEPDYQRANRGRREHLRRVQSRATLSNQNTVSEAVVSRGASMGPPVVFLLIALIFGAGFTLAHTVFSFGKAERSQNTPSTEQVSEVEAEKRAILQEARDALEAGAAERAVRLLNDALTTYPDSPEIFLDLALALHQTNRKKEARKALNTYRVLKGKEAE